MEPDKKKLCSIKIEPDTHKRLKVLSARTGGKLNEMADRLLREALQRRPAVAL